MSEHYLLIEGKRIIYKIKGSGEPLVLIHGYQADSYVWNRIIPKLSEKFTLIIPDLPGHGKSELVKPVNDMEFMAKLIFRIILAHAFNSVSIAGHSMGGYVALSFADQHPNYVDNVFLINSHPFEDSMSKVLNRERESQFIQNGKKHLLLMTFVKRNFSQTFRSEQPKEVQKITELALQQPEEGMLADIAGMMARTDKTNVRTKLRNKIQVILGSEDIHVPDHKYKDVQNMFDIHLVNDCGHMSILEKPEIVSSLILKNIK